jgi:hypothetical protein
MASIEATSQPQVLSELEVDVDDVLKRKLDPPGSSSFFKHCGVG